MQHRIGKYTELREYVETFNKGALDILIIEGSAGAGKSSIVKEVINNHSTFMGGLPKEYLWLEGRTTAAALYVQLYHHRDMPVIIDDVDGLYRDKEAVNLLKCLCQTWEEKSVQWNTMQKLKVGGIPHEFKTKSKVVVITNCWKTLNKHVGAIQDRGVLLLFHPSGEEVHKYVKDVLGGRSDIFDEEVYSFIEKNLGIIKEPSVRHYKIALQLKSVGMDWKKALIESFGLTENDMLVLTLCKDASLSHNQRAVEFAKILNKSERTYWRTKADLEAKGLDLN